MNRERVASLLSSGLKPGQVATVIGVSPARISQLLAEEDFKLILAGKTAEIEKQDIEEVTLSAKYSAAEHALINQVMEMAPASELRDVTAALRVIGDRQEKMKARLTTPQQQQNVNQVVVSITLPSHVVPNRTFEMTNNQEVIAIGEQTLAPLSSTAVTNLFSKLKNKETGGIQNEQSPSITGTKESTTETLPFEEVVSHG
jgi:uncharacterized protein (DUF1778 family)